jgi:hypothetical protein
MRTAQNFIDAARVRQLKEYSKLAASPTGARSLSATWCRFDACRLMVRLCESSPKEVLAGVPDGQHLLHNDG